MNSRSEADSTLTVKRSFVLHREVVRKPRVVLLSSDLREEDEEDKEKEEKEEKDSNEKNHQGRGIVKTKVAGISLLVFSWYYRTSESCKMKK
ncbi:hypothetical protein HZH68_003480 [Vespula germanica]|uniref:Uncharacterized protein n=1 Tax=Vespula germanica TaxID=30212 RepID=A0A834NPF1_VESGE|nr:hypothetical protein HZH68_003480 [Vespula germanica]